MRRLRLAPLSEYMIYHIGFSRKCAAKPQWIIAAIIASSYHRK
jgi:hypothetical protein